MRGGLNMSRFSSQFLALLFFTLVGCEPLVAWLPDSSGFMFIDPAAPPNLVFYSLKNNTLRVIDKSAGGGTLLPGISPDGKQVAVAYEGKPGTLQIIIFDINGKKLKESSVLSCKPNAVQKRLVCALHWGPTNKIVCNATRHDGTFVPRAFAYDLDRDKFYPFREGVHCCAIRPDGQGFLARENGGLSFLTLGGLSFLTWDGEERPILTRKDSEHLKHGFLDARWEKATMVLSGLQGTLALDTEKKTWSFAKTKNKMFVGAEKAFANGIRNRTMLFFHKFPGNGAMLAGFSTFHGERTQDGLFVGFLDPAKKRGNDFGQCYGISPSPDKKWVALHRRAHFHENSDIIVIDQEGQTAAKIQATKTGSKAIKRGTITPGS
jgi:hypothetical protein